MNNQNLNICDYELIKNRNPQDRNNEVKKLLTDLSKARLACEVTGFALGLNDDLLSPTRGSPQNAFARQLAMYITHVGFGISVSRVATAFARDRSTITHACHLIEDKRDDNEFDTFVDRLEECINSVPIYAN